MQTLQEFPFSKLVLPTGEEVLWLASNPTFHRTWDYGIVISNDALYLFSPFWLWFARWRRYPISAIHRAIFKDSYWCPKLILHIGARKVTFRTPYDGYQDEMNFDREHLCKTAEFLERYGVASNISSTRAREKPHSA